MNRSHLNGLEGTNPLGFLAALGVQVALAEKEGQSRLWWSNDVVPHAVVDSGITIEKMAEQIIEVLAEWRKSPAVAPVSDDGTVMPKGDELKFGPEGIRHYLACARRDSAAGRLATALVAEGSLDNQGSAKPSDLYFAAGNQKFLEMVRKIMAGVCLDDICVGLRGPWNYKSKLPSLGWDVADDRVYALRSYNPSSEKKLTNPGPESLAVLGLSTHPVFAGRKRTLTQGCSGQWKNGKYSWPLWNKPASSYAVKSLLAHAYKPDRIRSNCFAERSRWLRSWAVFKVLESPIRRSDQGGYGTFGPSEVVWQDDRMPTE